MKKTYIATAANGQVLKRSTERTYTHAVACKKTDGTYGTLSFCGSYELAEKQVHKWVAAMTRYPERFQDWATVVILPCHAEVK